MKRALLVLVSLVIMASCSNVGDKAKDTEEDVIKQRVEEMMLLDADQILTPDLLAIQQHAQSVHFEGDYFFGFEWNTGVFDVCSEPELTITGVKPIDSLHCDVNMRYLDEGCYDFSYTLNLLKEKGQWMIDNVTYNEGIYANLRVECEAFYEDVAELYREASADEIMEYLLGEEPSEENYTDPGTIYYNNPQAVKNLVDDLRNCLELFKKNPDYQDEMGQQVEAMIARIETHL